MTEDEAQDVLARTPSYNKLRASGDFCKACGAIVGAVGGDKEIHDEWHEAIRTLLPVGRDT